MAIGDSSGVQVKYSTVGADRAARKDRKVRESLKDTGRTAKQEEGSVKRWHERHKTALASIAAVTGGLLATIISQSPALRGELAGVRLGFSMLAMTVGDDVAPALEGLSDVSLGLYDAYADLPGPIRTATSALIVLGLVTAGTLATLALMQKLIAGTFVGAMLTKAAAMLTASGAGATLAGVLGGIVSVTGAVVAGIVLLAIGLGLVASEILGITDVTPIAQRELGAIGDMFMSLAFTLLGPFIGLFMVVVALFTDGLSGAREVAGQFTTEIANSFMRLGIHAKTGVYTMAALVIAGFRYMWVSARERTKDGISWVLGGVDRGVNRLVDSVLWAREMVSGALEAMFADPQGAIGSALNTMISAAESAVNSIIKAANKAPGVDIGTVSAGRVDTGSAGGIMESARASADAAMTGDHIDSAGLLGDTMSQGEINDAESANMNQRLAGIRDTRDSQLDMFAAGGVDMFGGDSSPDAFDPADFDRPDETHIDEGDDVTEVNISSMSFESVDEETDGEQTAEEIAKQLGSKQAKR